MLTPGDWKGKECDALQMLCCLSLEGEKEPGHSLEPQGRYHLFALQLRLSAQRGTMPVVGLRGTAVTQIIILISTQLRF